MGAAPRIVPCTAEHLPAVARIYAREAETSPATFDLAGRSPEWWQEVLDHQDPLAGHLLLVAVDGAGPGAGGVGDGDPGGAGGVLGYAKSGQFRDKAAYDTTVEVSAYVAVDARGRGVGGALYTELMAALERSNALLAAAGITEPNEASVRLHRAHGFTPVGTFHGVGVKFGQAWDVTWYERPLRPGGGGG